MNQAPYNEVEHIVEYSVIVSGRMSFKVDNTKYTQEELKALGEIAVLDYLNNYPVTMVDAVEFISVE